MSRMYTVHLAPTAITVAADLFEIAPASNKPTRIHSMQLYQTSDVGDSQEEIIGIALVRGNATSGSGGSSATPAPLNSTDPAAGATCEVANTTAASTGTAVTPWSAGWNVRIPTPQVWTPETQVWCNNGDSRIVLRMLAAPTDPLTIGGSITFEEC